MDIRRGELYYADLSPVVGSEQGGVRPVLVVQNDVGNKYSPTVIAAAVTSKMTKAKLPTHNEIAGRSYGLQKDSVILLEQIRTLDKRRLKERIGSLPLSTMQKVDGALLISRGCTGGGLWGQKKKKQRGPPGLFAKRRVVFLPVLPRRSNAAGGRKSP